jgi:hypothetical protein
MTVLLEIGIAGVVDLLIVTLICLFIGWAYK